MNASLSRIVWTAIAFFQLAMLPAASQDLKVREVFYPGGALKERYGYTLDAKGAEVRQGQDEEFYLDGVKKGVRTWKDGLENGPVLYFHPNGRKSYEANYSEGKKNGFATVWYTNGQKQWQTTFRDGKTNGVWREWYQDGKKKFEASYSNGQLDGLATWWHDNGRIWQERSYQSGSAVKGTVKEYDKTGKQTFPPPDSTPSGVESLGPAETPASTAAAADTGME